MKGLINLKNKDHKCFMWCHVRLINPTNSHPERINKRDKKIAANLNYSDIVFLLDKKHHCMSCLMVVKQLTMNQGQ